MGLFQITIWSIHLNNRISVSANETVCNWILKRSIIFIVILIGSYQEFLIVGFDFFQFNPGNSTETAHFMSPMSQSEIHFTM